MQENPKTIPESAEGMEYLVNLGRERTKIRTAVIDGHTYTVDTLRRVEPVYPSRPACFSASTLSGLADFLLADVDGLFARHPRCLVTVESPQRVSVYSPIYGEDQKRDLLARCRDLDLRPAHGHLPGRRGVQRHAAGPRRAVRQTATSCCALWGPCGTSRATRPRTTASPSA